MLVKIYWAVALAADVLISVFSGIVTDTADFWIPIVLLPLIFYCLCAANVLFCALTEPFVNKKKPRERPNRFFKRLLEETADMVMWVLRMKTVVEGEEIIPEDRRFYLVSNHISNFDPILTLINLSKYDVTFVSKPENFKLPVAGPLIHMCGYLPIDRSSPRSSMKTLHKCVDYIKNDIASVAIYPEGKRSLSGVLLEFKDGVFYVAKKAECPVVVMTVRYEKSKCRIYPFGYTKAILKYVRVLEPEEFANMSTHELSDKVREIMLSDGEKY